MATPARLSTRLTSPVLALVLAWAACLHAETPAEAIPRADAMARNDRVGALALLTATAASLTSPAQLPLRLETLTRQCYLLGDGEPAAALALADATLKDLDREAAGRWYGALQQCRGYVLEQLDRSEEAAAAYQLGIEEGARLGDDTLSAEAYVHRGELRYARGEYGDALADLKHSYDLFVRLGHRRDQTYVLNAIANLYGSAGEYERATDYYRQVLAAHEANGERREGATAHVNLGITLDKQGRYEQALSEYDAAQAIQRERHDLGEIAQIDRLRGIVLTKLGRAGDALPVLDAALAQFERSGDGEMQAETRVSRAVTLRALGRAREALAEYDAVLPWFERQKSRPFLEKIQGERALAYADIGDWAGAYAARTAQLTVQREIADQLQREQTARLRVAFDSEKTERENRDLQRENERRAEALQAAAQIRRLQTGVIALGALLLATLGVVALRQVAHARRLRTMALTDELTRLPNRRHILALADQEMRQAQRRGRPLCLMSLDVDHFKRINDSLGHDVGDRVLERVARACQAALKDDGRIGRVGGEEFLILLPAADANAAVAAAERIRESIARIDARDLAPTLEVTASIGLALARPEESAWSVVAKRADAALYAAKAAGRNCVMLATG